MKIQFKTFIIVLFSILSIACDSEKRENDLTRENLKGKVKSVKEISYYTEEKFGDPIKSEKYNQAELYFNEQGYFTEKNKHFKTETQSKETFKYNNQGNIIEKKEFFNSSWLNSTRITTYTYQYDDKENLIEEKENDENEKLKSRKVFKYDKKNNKTQYEWYGSDENLWEKYTYKYDERGNQIELNEFSADNILMRKYIYKYDEKGNQIEESKYNSDGKLEEKFIFKYDNNNNKIEEKLYDSDGKLEKKVVYSYNKGNLIEEKSYNSSDLLTNEWTCKYDDKANKREIRQNSYSSYGKLLYSKFYKYDERGNIIQNEEIKIHNTPQYTTLLLGDNSAMDNKTIYYDIETRKVSYKYDTNNNITEEITYTSFLLGSELLYDVEIQSNYIYQLDSIGNWVVKTGIEKNKVWTIIEREIEYY